MTDVSAPVSIVFTDIEGSTSLWETSPTAMQKAHARHNQILTETFTTSGGMIHKDKGDGFIVVFSNPVAAVLKAVPTGFHREMTTSLGWPCLIP